MYATLMNVLGKRVAGDGSSASRVAGAGGVAASFARCHHRTAADRGAADAYLRAAIAAGRAEVRWTVALACFRSPSLIHAVGVARSGRLRV